MPHCIFEYSANIADNPKWSQMIGKIHEGLIATGQFVAEDIKSRVIRHDNYRIGTGGPNQSFVTLNLQILEGRSDAFKHAISKMALEILLVEFQQSLSEQSCSVTVQVSDIHRASYQRYVSY